MEEITTEQIRKRMWEKGYGIVELAEKLNTRPIILHRVICEADNKSELFKKLVSLLA